MYAQWRTSVHDLISISFWKDILLTVAGNLKRLFVVVIGMLLVTIGAFALSLPMMLDQFMGFLEQLRFIGLVGQLLLSAVLESALFVFVLQACAPARSKASFMWILTRVGIYWVFTSLLFGFAGLYLPLIVMDVLRIVAQFALFAAVYDRKAFVKALRIGAEMTVGSFPLVFVLVALTIGLFMTQDFILSLTERVIEWWGVSFSIVALYSLIRPALLIALYQKHKKLYR